MSNIRTRNRRETRPRVGQYCSICGDKLIQRWVEDTPEKFIPLRLHVSTDSARCI